MGIHVSAVDSSNCLNDSYMSTMHGVHVGASATKSVMNALAPAAPESAKALGALGSALSVGIAIHGWSTSKTLQVTVRQHIEDLDNRVPHFERWLADVGSECMICLQPLSMSDSTALTSACENSKHVCHKACLRSRAWHISCPLCQADTQTATCETVSCGLSC